VICDELKDRLGRRSVRLIDVGRRSSIERHIPSALSIPVVALPQRLDALPKRPEIVAYCRGPYCAMAYKAVEILRPAATGRAVSTAGSWNGGGPDCH
jgi:rhodanese-related sulfurtransferase